MTECVCLFQLDFAPRSHGRAEKDYFTCVLIFPLLVSFISIGETAGTAGRNSGSKVNT